MRSSNSVWGTECGIPVSYKTTRALAFAGEVWSRRGFCGGWFPIIPVNYLRVKNCKETDHGLTHHYIKSHRKLWKGENDPDSEEMPGGKHLWDRWMCHMALKAAAQRRADKGKSYSSHGHKDSNSANTKGKLNWANTTQRRLKRHLSPRWENMWLMIIYIFLTLKVQVCTSKRRTRQIKYDWRLDIKNWQEEGVLVSVRTDSKTEDRQQSWVSHLGNR